MSSLRAVQIQKQVLARANQAIMEESKWTTLIQIQKVTPKQKKTPKSREKKNNKTSR